MSKNVASWHAGLKVIVRQYRNTVVRVTGKGYMSGLQLNDAQDVAEFQRIGFEQTGIITCVGGIRGDVLLLGLKLDSPREIIDEALTSIEDMVRKI